MKSRLLPLLTVLLVVLVACSDDDPELSTESTILTGGTNAPATSTTTAGDGETGGSSPSTTLAGQTVTDFTVFARFPNDNGEERWYVIPSGAYTDIDLENFVVDLIEDDPALYGAEIFGSEEAATAYQVPEADRTEAQVAILATDHYVTLIARDSIEFRGPFAEFPGGAIGS